MPPAIQIDFSKVEDDNCIPDGRYPIIVDDVIAKDSNDGLSVYLLWTLNVTMGEHEGRSLRYLTSLKSTVLWRLKASLKALDVPVDGVLAFDLDDDGRVLDPELIGRVGVADVGNETFEKVKRNNVSGLFHISTLDEGRNGMDMHPLMNSSLPMTEGVGSDSVASPKAPKGGLKLK